MFNNSVFKKFCVGYAQFSNTCSRFCGFRCALTVKDGNIVLQIPKVTHKGRFAVYVLAVVFYNTAYTRWLLSSGN